jgi:TolA-binding protein
MKANRALIKKYLHTSNHHEKYSVEKAFVDDDFVMDALEGFQQQKDAWQNFEAIDRKYNKTKRNIRLGFLGLSICCAGFLGWYLLSNTNKVLHKPKLQAQTKVVSIKIHQKKDVQQMKIVAPEEQITPRLVQINFNTSGQIEETKGDAFERMQQIPLQRLELKKQGRLQLKIARELYIKDFKIVDYRYYRKSESNATGVLSENNFGEQEVKLPYVNILNKAIEHFAKKDYKLALLIFDDVLQTYPDDANALFYGAMCLYNLGAFDQAESRFVKIQSIPFGNFNEEANWYLLHVYRHTKKEAAFSSLRKSIIEQEGFYAQKAENLEFN